MTQSEHDRTVYLTITDPKVMRAMAHPARVAIIEYLSDGAEATATECAQVCGLSPSATSYHLRALASADLIEDAPSRGDGRERVWRGSMAGYFIDTDSSQSPEVVAATAALLEVVLNRDERRAREWLARAHEEPPEWSDAVGLVRKQLLMTADELARLQATVLRLMEPYHRSRRLDPPPGARKIAALFRAFPTD